MIRFSSILLLLVMSSVVLGQPVKWKLPPGEKLLHTVQATEMEGEVKDWGLANLNVPDAWSKSKGKGVVVGVLDTGVMRNHRDIKGNLLSAKDYTGSPSGPEDKNGHGTWCCGRIVAMENSWGLVGVSPLSKLRSYKVLADDGGGQTDWIAKAWKDAVDDGCDVISLSLGGPEADNDIPPMIKYARERGVIVFVAVGNDGPANDTIDYPGRYPGVIAIGAHDANNRVADFSSRGPQIFCSGPGVQTRSTWIGGGDGQFATISGSSMSTPSVAGICALWIAANPGIAKKDRPAKFEEALRLSCTRPNGRNTSSGYGKPDAVKLLAQVSTVPGPQPLPTISIEITEADLSVAGLSKLRAAGFEKFSFILKGANGVAPKVEELQIKPKEVQPKKADAKSVDVPFQVQQQPVIIRQKRCLFWWSCW